MAIITTIWIGNSAVLKGGPSDLGMKILQKY